MKPGLYKHSNKASSCLIKIITAEMDKDSWKCVVQFYTKSTKTFIANDLIFIKFEHKDNWILVE